jgi:hypothetical protein
LPGAALLHLLFAPIWAEIDHAMLGTDWPHSESWLFGFIGLLAFIESWGREFAPAGDSLS